MSKFATDLSQIEAVIFDVDGVLSRTTTVMNEAGIPMRTANVRDGYAIKEAARCGITIGIISGAFADNVPKRYGPLGVKHIYMGQASKRQALEHFVKKSGVPLERILFCGDDIPDIAVMKLCGCAIAPQDAAPEVKAIAHQILPVRGGEGVARMVLEELLKMKGLWLKDEGAFEW